MSKSALYNYHEDYCSRFDSKKTEIGRLKLLVKEIDIWVRLQDALNTIDKMRVKLRHLDESQNITPAHCDYEIAWLVTHYATNFRRERIRKSKTDLQFI